MRYPHKMSKGKWRKYASEADRFWSKVDKSAGPRVCWPWLAGCAEDGYGHFHVDVNKGVPRTAHSVALELRDGHRPEGAYALHTCDNPPCCNPRHLFWGDHDANMRQKKERGRAFRMPGETHHQAKLTDKLVLELRRRYIPRHPEHGASAIARELGMSQYAISQAVTGRGWGHL